MYIYISVYIYIARVDPNLGSKNGRFRRFPGCRSATMAAVGADMRRQSLRQVARRCAQRPRPRLHARPVDVDRPDVLALRFLTRQLPKTAQIGPCPRSGFGLLAFRSCTRIGSPYNRPPPRLLIRRPYVACEQPAATYFSPKSRHFSLFQCLPKLGHCPK